MPRKIQVVQDPEDEVPFEVIATAIQDISDGMKKLDESRLTRTALVILLSAQTGLAKGVITRVLGALDQLEKIYLKPKKK